MGIYGIKWDFAPFSGILVISALFTLISIIWMIFSGYSTPTHTLPLLWEGQAVYSRCSSSYSAATIAPMRRVMKMMLPNIWSSCFMV
jgi:hypothetical protein